MRPCAKTTWKNDRLVLVSGTLIFGALILYALGLSERSASLRIFCGGVVEFLSLIWWGIILGIVFISLLGQVPRESVIRLLGRRRGLSGLLRAALAGLFFDLCSHGILMVGAKLYERGATAGQTVAFLISSPWNSFSLTLVLIGLIGLPWTLAFIVLSLVVALVSGLLFDWFEQRGGIPSNPNRIENVSEQSFLDVLGSIWSQLDWSSSGLVSMLRSGLEESRMVIRWFLFGIVVAATVRVFLSHDMLSSYFGPSLGGQALTLLAATIIEVCSEGSVPLAADLFTIARAPGNAFLFLMAGAATDYTEIVILHEYTKSWKIALLLPLVTVPQVYFLAFVLNQIGL